MHAALATWPGIATSLLIGLTAVIAVVEFLGGPELKLRVKTALENWWLRLADIPAPKIGEREARYAITLIDTIFGNKKFSRRRIAMSVAVVASSYLVVFLLHYGPHLPFGLHSPAITWEQAVEWEHIGEKGGWDVHAPWEASWEMMIWDTLSFAALQFVFLWLTVWTSIALTRWILDQALKRFIEVRYSTVLFVGSLFLSVFVTNGILGPIAEAFTVTWWQIGYYGPQMTWLFLLQLPFGMVSYISSAVAGLSYITSQGELVRGLMALPSREPFLLTHDLSVAYLVLILLFWLRIGIAVGYFGWWLSGSALKLIRLTIYRFSEREEGALTIASGVLTAISGFITFLTTCQGQ